MMGFAIAVFIVAISILLIWLTVKAMDGSMQAGVAAIGLVIVILGALINADIEKDKKGPCHQYETRMMYNAATKTMMPSRVCILRGEWVEDNYGEE